MFMAGIPIILPLAQRSGRISHYCHRLELRSLECSPNNISFVGALLLSKIFDYIMITSDKWAGADIFIVLSLLGKTGLPAPWPDIPLSHIIFILNKPMFALSP